jgi:hypothetical protein
LAYRRRHEKGDIDDEEQIRATLLFDFDRGSGRGLVLGRPNDRSVPPERTTASKPSELRITDVRMAMAPVGGGLIRLDTNQGIYGIGENRDGARPG